MRIVVISDSHGIISNVRKTLMREPKAEAVFFLGDGENDINRLKSDFPEKCFFMVRGNCDWGSGLDKSGTVTLEDKKIFYTHGHIYSVKSGDEIIKETARSCYADILLYGHTHIARNTYENGLYIMNPGAASGYEATYGVIEILENGVLMNIVKVPN